MTVIRRADWEEPGFTVAEHTTSPRVDIDDVDTIVLHYPGGGYLWTPDPVAYMRAMQRSYIRQRGYSIGYNWAYWPDGTEIELRTLAFRNAANSVSGDDGRTNRRTIAVFLIVANGDPATGPQMLAVRERVAELEAATGRRLDIIGHGDLEPTACPGSGIADQLAVDLFRPRPLDPEDPAMPAIAYYLLPPETYPKGSPEFVVIDGSIRYRTNGDRPGILPDVRVPADQYDNIRKAHNL